MSKHPIRKLASTFGLLGLSCAAAVSQSTINVPGFLKFEVYTNITGSTVAELTASPNFPGSPGRTFYMPSFDTRLVYPDDTHDNYGGRITGYITPTETASYEFFLRSDDASELWLSSDDNAANLQKIAEETACCGPFEEPGAPETSFAREMLAGQRYAIEVRYKDGTGGDFCQVAWRRDGDTTPAAQLTPVPIAFLSTPIPARGSIAVTQQPSNITAAENDTVTLSVNFTATHAPAAVQWQRNGVNVPGLVGRTAKFGPLKTTDAGTYRAIISIPGAFTNSATANVTVAPDTTPPAIRSVVGQSSFDKLTLEFTEPVDATSAVDQFAYSFDGGLTFLDATLVNSTTVILRTSPQTPGTTYTVSAANVLDMAGLSSGDPGTTKTFTTLDRVAGGLKFETWLGITGTAISGLTGDPRYPNSPDVSAYITQFTSRQIYADANSVNDYGGRLSGWIVPPESGDYEFFIRSDDSSQLFLSTDENPENAVMIASEDGCCGPFEAPGAPETSTPQTLVGGNRYYIHALWKEGGGGDYCDVAWRKVGDTTLPVNLPFIPGSVLESYAPAGTFVPPTVTIVSPVAGSESPVGEPVTIIADATAASGKTISKVEFIEQGRVIGTSTSAPFEFTFYDLREDNHTITARASDSSGQVTVSEPVTFSVGTPVATVKIAAIDTETSWRYDRSGSDLGTAWQLVEFDDSAWPEGLALIADEGTTTVEPIRTRINRFNDQGAYVRTFYFRKKFTFGAVTPEVKLKLRHVVDDGAVFYLNGQEIHRFGIAADVVVDYLTDAAGHENIYEGPYDISPALLVEGDNILACEVHQSGGSSSDMVFGAELIATVPLVRTTMSIARNGASVNISWAPTGGTLESAPTPAGPWTTVANATNPLSVSAATAPRFYRLKR
ncbi:MAG: hypothetical protein IPK15_13625 [Verrucomicrobia bacterium]|nr:hypothetical protein [Verrucomicrobiota bacterium]